jgi:hypothetical protein
VAISSRLRSDLAALTAALDQPGSDLEALLGDFVADLSSVISSYRGLSMRITVAGNEAILTLLEDEADDVASSMRLPLSALSASHGDSVLVLYAAKPGAFVDLAADLCVALSSPPETVTLDEDLDRPFARSGLVGLAEQSTVNLAIGVLVDRGHTLTSAGHELQKRAARRGLSVHAIALAVLRSL